MCESMCRTCGGFACPETSTELFDEKHKDLLHFIQRTCKFTIRAYQNLPSLICKNCEAEVIFPAKFTKRCANAQFFFWTSAYYEKLKLLEKYHLTDYRCFNSNDEQQITSEKQCIPRMEGSGSESDDEDKSTDFHTGDQIPILTTKDVFKPPQRDKYGKTCKRQMYKCEKCNSLIIDRHNFISHMKRHLGVKPFQCSHCPNKYYTKSELKRHNYRHLNYRPHKCQYCDSSYFTKGEKDRHERSCHTGEKPFICETCGRTFSARRNLIKHTKIHKGDKPYKCVQCNKSFRLLKQLKIHYTSITHKKSIY